MDSDHPECISKNDVIAAHGFANNHKEQIEKDKVCGCFYCLKIFDPAEIIEWLIDNNPCDRDGMVLCPYCGIDSVIGESSGFPITEDFLKKMQDYWF